jgi:hypothetical protein
MLSAIIWALLAAYIRIAMGTHAFKNMLSFAQGCWATRPVSAFIYMLGYGVAAVLLLLLGAVVQQQGIHVALHTCAAGLQ